MQQIPTEHSDSTTYSSKDQYCSKLLDFAVQEGARALIDAGVTLLHDLDVEFCHDRTLVASDFDQLHFWFHVQSVQGAQACTLCIAYNTLHCSGES